MGYGNPHSGNPHSERRSDIEKAAKPATKTFKCPHCGKTISASNAGGASVGGGT